MKYWRVEIMEKGQFSHFNKIIGVIAENVEESFKKTHDGFPDRQIISINCGGKVDIL